LLRPRATLVSGGWGRNWSVCTRYVFVNFVEESSMVHTSALFFSAISLAAFLAPDTPSARQCDIARNIAVVRPGLDVLLSSQPAWLIGKRIGLITNQSGISATGERGIDLLAARNDVHLVKLFALEHGLAGTKRPGEKIGDGVDSTTGLPIVSLYGSVRKPTPEMLRDIDVLMFDVMNAGSRTLTSGSAMALAMQSAAEAKIPFVVLDRPNPITGSHVEGPVLDTAFSSFVGMYPIPLRHGMTVGELATLYNEKFGIGAKLTVIRLEGWKRTMWFDETGLPWVRPSPNLRRLNAVLLYPGMVLLEGTNLSEGRGTEYPFEQTGAPWMRSAEVVKTMNRLDLSGVRFDTVMLSVQSGEPKYGGRSIPGVKLTVTDRDAIRPVATAMFLLEVIRKLHPKECILRPAMDLRGGTDKVRKAIEEGRVGEFMEESEKATAVFGKLREQFLLYR